MTCSNMSLRIQDRCVLTLFVSLLIGSPLLGQERLLFPVLQEVLTNRLQGAKVPDAEQASLLAMKAYIRTSGLSAQEGPSQPSLMEVGFPVEGYAKVGDKIWEVRITALTKDGNRAIRAIIWVHAQTGQARFVGAGGGPRAANVGLGLRDLQDTSKVLRQGELKHLIDEYETVSSNVIAALDLARIHHKDDVSYLSPLHIAISAISAWRILAAENSLFELIDYQLNTRTLPVGMCMDEAYAFPAAGALVDLRVDCNKVIRVISATSSKKRQLVLAWILQKRMGSREVARAMLLSVGEKFYGETEVANIHAVMRLLESSVNFLDAAMREGAQSVGRSK